ncbi:MAG: hypothetical protein CL610_07595 [Anaerolineaceae bacterium]|nr:hypothetical protein [Anaerolineaceae bacterium]
MKILLTNTLDREGGAEQVALSLLEGYRKRGHSAWLAVGAKRTHDPHVMMIRHGQQGNLWRRFWWKTYAACAGLYTRFGPAGEKLRRILTLIAEPTGILETLQGYEHSHFPGTYQLLSQVPERPDILHLHSLQRGYFELEALPWLTAQVPTVLTLHDAWLLSGHCTHPFGCDRWKTGCGACPDLTIPPAVLRDETARNWRRKRHIFASSRLWLAVDSHWLLEKAKASMLTYEDTRVIYPGVDLDLFRPGDQAAARKRLGLPADARILLFVATQARANRWKDFALLQAMMQQFADRPEEKVILLVVGDPQGNSLFREGNIWFAPLVPDSHQLVPYYHAADLYVHATHVETFGLSIVEAMACGLPVVASRVGAIPETVVDGQCGYLTRHGDMQDMFDKVGLLFQDEQKRRAMANAATVNAQRFDLNMTIDAYLAWYSEITQLCAAETDIT